MPSGSATAANAQAADARWASARKAIRMAASPVLWIVALFGGAGSLNWSRGWISVAMYVVGMLAIGLVVRRYNAPVMEARSQWRRADTKPFDKFFLGVLFPLVFLQPVVAGLDAVRFHWSSMPFETVYVGAALFAPAMALIAWTLAVNRHAETSVRIQTDRGHTVVSSGPYRVVRHPMYVGAILMYAATPLFWGSVWASAISGLLIALFVWRTALEDRTLRRELPGYEEYARRTRDRLLPGLW
jgi:protein-S-isoprenylcysteine O-methyltransferase Ste14